MEGKDKGNCHTQGHTERPDIRGRNHKIIRSNKIRRKNEDI